MQNGGDEKKIERAVDEVFARLVSNESLEEFAKRAHASLREGSTGPLRIAKEVVKLGEEWERRRGEAEGKTYSQWLSLTFGPTFRPRWWRLRAMAVQEFKTLAFRLHHEAAVTMLQSVQRVYWPGVWERVNRQYHGLNKRSSVTREQLRRIVDEVTGRKPMARDLNSALEILRAQVRRLGEEPEA